MAPREEAWDSPAPPLRTPRGVVHVWRASLDPPGRRLESLLRIRSDAERSRPALTVDGDPGASSRWWLRDLAPAPGYVAALANEEDQVLPTTRVQWPEWFQPTDDAES